MSQTTERWTARKLLAWMTQRFESNSIDSPRLLAEMLLSNVFGSERIDLYAKIDRIATDQEREELREYVQRAMKHEPVQYIVGNAWFFGMEFEVNQSTLIPRSCTEVIVMQAIKFCKDHNLSPKIADIGTGCGCIAIALATQLPQAQIFASDISKDALALAQKNAETHGVTENITFLHGDELQPFEGSFDIICSNPPYIPQNEFASLDQNVRLWEPEIALSGGRDGLDIISPLIETAPEFLIDGGCLLIEIASSIKDSVLDLAKNAEHLFDAKILRDQHGDDRFLRAYKT